MPGIEAFLVGRGEVAFHPQVAKGGDRLRRPSRRETCLHLENSTVGGNGWMVAEPGAHRLLRNAIRQRGFGAGLQNGLFRPFGAMADEPGKLFELGRARGPGQAKPLNQVENPSIAAPFGDPSRKRPFAGSRGLEYGANRADMGLGRRDALILGGRQRHRHDERSKNDP